MRVRLPACALLMAALRIDGFLHGQEMDNPYLDDETVPCWMACVRPYGSDTRMISGRAYRLANCYLSGPGQCTCVWVSM